MAPVRRCFRSGDAAFVALLAATALVSVQSYSLGSVFGGSSLGLRSQTSAFCQGPTCLKPTVPSPSLRARTHRGTFALQTSKPTSSAALHSSCTNVFVRAMLLALHADSASVVHVES